MIEVESYMDPSIIIHFYYPVIFMLFILLFPVDFFLIMHVRLFIYLFIHSGKHDSTGDLSSDLRTWLSAALANQETCRDGFEGTSGIVKSVVSGSLNQITSLVTELLTMVHPSSSNSTTSRGGGGRRGKGPGRKLSGDSPRFPRWVKSEDRKLLQVSGVTADLVVAQDGSGNFTKVEDAIAAVPDYGTRRFVIYVKKGVYRENVEIKKKKWNIMMVGDGMDATVISGNRSFVDGWTTFRTATFGEPYDLPNFFF